MKPSVVEVPEAQTAPRLLRKPAVAALVGLTERSITNKVREGVFPKPVLLDARQVAFVESEVRAWIQARVIDRDTGYVPQARKSIERGRLAGGQKTAQQRKTSKPAAR